MFEVQAVEHHTLSTNNGPPAQYQGYSMLPTVFLCGSGLLRSDSNHVKMQSS